MITFGLARRSFRWLHPGRLGAKADEGIKTMSAFVMHCESATDLLPKYYIT